MSAQLIETFAKTNKVNFSIDEIKKLLKDYFKEEDDNLFTAQKQSCRDSYKFLKTKWYYGYKNLPTKDVFKHITLRILHTQVASCRDVLDIDERQKFNNYDKVNVTDDTEFDLTGCPSYTADSDDIYVINPKNEVYSTCVDEMLMTTYKFYTNITKINIQRQIGELNSVIDELSIIAKIKPHLSVVLKMTDPDVIMQKLHKLIGIDIRLIREVIDKYKIKKLLTVSTDISDLQQKVSTLKSRLQTVENYVVSEYETLLKSL